MSVRTLHILKDFWKIAMSEVLILFSLCAQAAGTDVGINYFVRVLQQGAWPLSQNNLSPLAIPVELEKVCESFHYCSFFKDFIQGGFNQSNIGRGRGRFANNYYPLSWKDLPCPFLPATPLSLSRTLEGLLELTR